MNDDHNNLRRKVKVAQCAGFQALGHAIENALNDGREIRDVSVTFFGGVAQGSLAGAQPQPGFVVVWEAPPEPQASH